MFRKAFPALALLLALAACKAPAPTAGDIGRDRLLAHDGSSGDWLTGGNDWRGSYFSKLAGIDAGNANRLGFAWAYDVGETRGQEATPVVVDGVLYVSTNWGKVIAVDAATGKQRWVYDPEVDGQFGRYACCDVVNRGVAVWQGTVYVGATDGWLHAIDAATGKRKWKADTLDADMRATKKHYTISGAPQIAGGVVVIGNGGADFGVRGFVRAFDLADGKRRWTFWTVPHDPKTGPQEGAYLDAALKTWDPASDWSYGGGGTAWDGLAYDPTLDLLYVGTGNASPYNYQERSKGKGDNLYLASIVAIDPKSGDLKWHYQTVPGDAWDYTAVQKMILADLNIDGRDRQVIMQAPKNGLFYVIDRKTGELISAKPYTFVNWTTGIDPKTRAAIVSPAAKYYDAPKLIYPSMAGGHNWNPMAYNPGTGLVYIPVIDAPMVFVDTAKRPIGTINGTFNVFGMFPEGYDPKALKPAFGAMPAMADLTRTAGGPPKPQSRGFIRAWDPVKARIAWEVPTPTMQDGGIMTTAGNIIISGDPTGHLVVRRADTGATLKSIDTGTSIMAAPMTYRIGDTQYVAVLAGLGGAGNWTFAPNTAAYKYGNAARLLVFKLDGGAVPLPEPLPPLKFDEPPPKRTFTAAQAAKGEDLYVHNCSVCHGFGRGLLPDLRRISPATHDVFNQILLEGLYVPKGMANFSDTLSKADVEAIHAFVSREQQALYKQETDAAAKTAAAPPKVTH